MKLLLAQKWSIILLLVLAGIMPLHAQEKVTLVFNEDGKLASNYLTRVNPPLYKQPCKDKYRLSAKVLLPLDFFEEEGKKIDSMASLTRAAIADTNSMLYKILQCGKDGELNKLKTIINDTADITSWQLKEYNKEEEIIPQELISYVRFMRLLKVIRDNSGKEKNVDSLLAILNKNYKNFSPYRLKVKGFILDTSCFRFVSYPYEEDPCHCIDAGKRYIAVEFGIPYSIIKKDMSVDSFQVVQYFFMKKLAIERYNDMLKKHAKDIAKLKLLQETIKQNTGSVEKLLQALNELDMAGENCKPEVRDSLEKKWNTTICDLKDNLAKDLGEFNCRVNCDSGNAIFCSKILPRWILKLVWLNGDLIRLNPFKFTNAEFTPIAPKEAAVSVKPKSKEETDLENKNAATKIAFWSDAIKHLQDSVMIIKPLDVDIAKARLTRLIAERDSAQLVLNKNMADQKKADAAKSKVAAGSADNDDDLVDFATIFKVKYKGWLIPYQQEPKRSYDKMWLRNYYYNGNGTLSFNGKPHFTYPEDENVTLLIHNLSPGAAVNINESIVPAKDSSAWTIFAVKATANASLLYSSLGTVAPLVRKALQTWNSSVKTSGPVPEASAQISNVGFKSESFNLSKQKDLKDLKDYLKKPESTGGSVIIKAGAQVTGFQLQLNNIEANFNSIINKANQLAEKETAKKECLSSRDICYINYLKALLAIRTAPDIIDKELKTREDSVPAYFTYKYTLADSQATYINKYNIRVASSAKADSMNQSVKTASYIKVAQYHYLELAAGVAYTPNGGSVTAIDTSNGGFKINRDEDKARLIAGIRIYPFGLYNLKNPVGLFREYRWMHRLSLLVATGIPKPLQNVYAGAGFDVMPGLTLSAGMHLQQQNRFEVSNNQVKDRSTNYRGHMFYSLTMDPTILISAITSLIKN